MLRALTKIMLLTVAVCAPLSIHAESSAGTAAASANAYLQVLASKLRDRDIGIEFPCSEECINPDALREGMVALDKIEQFAELLAGVYGQVSASKTLNSSGFSAVYDDMRSGMIACAQKHGFPLDGVALSNIGGDASIAVEKFKDEFEARHETFGSPAEPTDQEIEAEIYKQFEDLDRAIERVAKECPPKPGLPTETVNGGGGASGGGTVVVDSQRPCHYRIGGNPGVPVGPGGTPVGPPTGGGIPVTPGGTPVTPGGTPVIPGGTSSSSGGTPTTAGGTPVSPGTPVTPGQPGQPVQPPSQPGGPPVILINIKATAEAVQAGQSAQAIGGQEIKIELNVNTSLPGVAVAKDTVTNAGSGPEQAVTDANGNAQVNAGGAGAGASATGQPAVTVTVSDQQSVIAIGSSGSPGNSAQLVQTVTIGGTTYSVFTLPAGAPVSAAYEINICWTKEPMPPGRRIGKRVDPHAELPGARLALGRVHP